MNRTSLGSTVFNGRESGMKSTTQSLTQVLIRRSVLSSGIMLALACNSASAVELTLGDEISGSWDTTVSYGAAWRMDDYEEDQVGKAALNPTVGFLDNAGQRAAP